MMRVLISGLVGASLSLAAFGAPAFAKKGTWVSREDVIMSETTRPRLIFALQAGNWEQAKALGRQGSLFGMRGMIEQREFLKTHLKASRFYCPSLAEVAPPNIMEGNDVEFSGNLKRGNARFTYKNATQRNAVLDAQVLVEELGCAALKGYAGNVYKFLRNQTD